MNKIKIAVLLLLSVFAGIVTTVGQSNAKLTIGDTAPALKYAKWIKGEPVKSFEGDHLYVLEFWATWCGPCKAAMPHITKLQQEYKGKVTFIGVDVWEKVAEGKPYESTLPMVEKFVKGNDANMEYAVVADNNEQFMGNNWLKAAGQNGIPSTFIIKNNQILWIGHPNSLDTALPAILNGRFDMATFKAAYDKSADAGRNSMVAMQALVKPIQDAITAKDYTRALQLMDKAVAESAQRKTIMEMMKFGVLLNHVSQQQAIAYAEELQQTNKSMASVALGEIYNKDVYEKSTYIWAAKNYEAINPTGGNPVLIHALATCYAKGGDYEKAVTYEEQAVASARKALKNGEMVGSVMDYTVKEYEQALTEYKQKLK
ncbi:Thioredoxin [Chitinophaga jiangningensis]|uniref:Thioredoxin n=1 Tax=Chitinophaga jiangningensis TaxID=1419482 RepID=A0A1M7K7X7_9BACT|nr:TlpA disulfide reductase family protein [Chitinophaga jiangningensis]SHM61399.1 Thioredoxin [Chitinophaga jiangningensis]